MAAFADLHLHTHHSDGVRTPAEVVSLTKERGLAAIAITDHDNLAAFAEAEPLARKAGIELVPGVELSIEWEGVDIHLLAYSFDPEDAALCSKLQLCRDTRARRGEMMVEKLDAVGVPISLERVRQLCGKGAMGRPHVARCLVENGVVASIDEAFDRFLSPGMPGWVEKERISLSEAIEMVRAAGGVTSIAHPALYPDGERLVRAMLPLGVDGIEVLHPNHDEEASQRFAAIADEHAVMRTGGSDDHGFADRRTLGSVRVPLEQVRGIFDRWRRRAR
ncbi:MAG TPA: PHP domain-containing protein [Thermoanaerobaculia bacterium]|nr:PHP domain-containing protein [Thermoanaerobaculia bacterium]